MARKKKYYGKRTLNRKKTVKGKQFKGIIPIAKDFFRRLAVSKKIIWVLACLLLIVIFAFATRKNAAQVYVGETLVGTVKGKAESAEDLESRAVAIIEAEKGAKVQINEKVTLSIVHASKSDMSSKDYIVTQIKNTLTYKIEAAGIIVAGTELAIVKNEDSANEILNTIKEQYENADGAEFVEEVRLNKRYISENDIMPSEEALSKLKASNKEKIPYTIVKGDSLTKIAQKANITKKDLLDANPGLTETTTLRVGDEINLVSLKPVLSVKTVERATYTEKIPKPEPVYQNDPALYTGMSVIKQKGSEGEKEVTVEITKINGQEQSRKTISENPIKDAVQEIIAKGTKQR